MITGSNLQRILPDAFAGMFTHELTIRISGTTVSRFPDGLLKYLPDIRYLTLDLRNNQLTTMGPGVLAAVTREGPDIHQTQHIAGKRNETDEIILLVCSHRGDTCNLKANENKFFTITLYLLRKA